ncbi:PD-(D/E)XK nuclease family transposase [Faecalibaculum rodentium]|jgi:hypothetical protein|uniref:PD-(D/E)XK nuclease family transposase n=2 Tax=Faecalibaculum rodentium TaxID=1702221 RepID=UPI002491E989|nr:PD-(D/E)XK nuclease family transposase [Faecalibaculum rodentium]
MDKKQSRKDTETAGWPWSHSLYPDLDPVRDKTKLTVLNYRLIDDLFARVALKDIPAVQLILRIILKMPDLRVISVKVQELPENGVNRSLWLDVLAEDETGRRFNVEVQNGKEGFSPRRMRHHASMMDATLLEKGGNWQTLPETYVIFAVDKDYPGGGLPLYEYEVLPKGHEVRMDFGLHFVVVNGEWQGKDELGRLMADMHESNPMKMHYPALARRCLDLKTDDKEVRQMCDAVQKLVDESRAESRTEIAINFLREQVAPELVS